MDNFNTYSDNSYRTIFILIIIILIIICGNSLYIYTFCKWTNELKINENFTLDKENYILFPNTNEKSAMIILNNSLSGSATNISSPSSIILDLPNCNAPSISIENLSLPSNDFASPPKDTYITMDTSDLTKKFNTTVYLPNNFDTLTLTDQAGNTTITISQSSDTLNLIKEVVWTKNSLRVICEFNPESQSKIKLSWEDCTIYFVPSRPGFTRLLEDRRFSY